MGDVGEVSNMKKELNVSGSRYRVKGIATVTALVVGLGACSSLPEWANPVDWYDAAFSDDAATPPKSDRKTAVAPVRKEAKSFPALKAVPDKAPETMSQTDRKKVADGLVADRDKAKYTDEDLRSGGTGSTTVASDKPVMQPAPKPEPAPMPKPVAVAPKPMTAEPKVVMADPAAPRPVRPTSSRMPKLASASSTPKPVAPPPPAPLPPLSVAPQPVAVAPAAPAAPVAPVAVAPIAAAPQISQTPPPAPLPPLVAPAPTGATAVSQRAMAAPSFPNAGQNTLSQAFAASLAQSASTVSTAPAHSTFAAPGAAPLSPGQYKVPNIVLAAYNNPLTGKSPASTTVTPGQTLNVVPFSTNRQLNVAPGQVILVKFSNGSSRLNAKGRAQIRKAARSYKAKGKGLVRVVGHASHRTRDMDVAKHRMTNFGVSLDRANVVARELMRQGIKASVVRVEAKSDSDPVFFEYMPAGEAQNRRTEIFLGF